MAMALFYDNCKITLAENDINCNYSYAYTEDNWQLKLLNDRIVYTKGRKEISFLISNIKELEFEVDGGGHRRENLSIANAYVILNDNDDPQHLFTFGVRQEFILANETKTYEFCQEVLKFIGSKYSIPVSYKLSIDTRAKRRRLWLIPLIFIVTYGWFLLMHYLENHH